MRRATRQAAAQAAMIGHPGPAGSAEMAKSERLPGLAAK